MKNVAIAVIIALAALYLGDYVLSKDKPLEFVQIRPFYEIHQKSGKVELDYNVPPETQTCVSSLFPHDGNNPCWYVTKHRTRKIEI